MDRRRAFIFSLLLLCTAAAASAPPEGDEWEGVPGVTDALFFQYRLLVRDFLDTRCNFSPSCSRYGQAVLSDHGPVIGAMMALERWTRCHSSAGRLEYYPGYGSGIPLRDPPEVDEGNVMWDSLLLPF